MIKGIEIENFKNLRHVQVMDLQAVNLLIGPNNSGKSNFLKAFEAVANKFAGKQFPLRDQRKGNRGSVTVKIFFEYTNTDYFCRIIIIENQIPFGTQVPDFTFFKIENNSVISAPSNDEPSLLFHLEQLFKNVDIYIPTPEALKRKESIQASSVLNSNTGNIVSFLFDLSQNHRKLFRALENDLKDCTGDIVNLSTPPVVGEPGKIEIKFFDKNDNDYQADEVSDGVLYFLTLLCILYQPNPPKLLLLEEPEKGIHPRRIHEIMEFIFRLAEDKGVQVILTSHSVHVVDEFADIPEAVYVFEKQADGSALIKNLKKEIIEPSNQRSDENNLPRINYTDSLGEHWAIGLLGGVPV